MEPLILAECLRNAAIRLRKFREEYGVWTAPVDTFRLLREITERGKIRVQWEKVATLPEDADAFTATFTAFASGFLARVGFRLLRVRIGIRVRVWFDGLDASRRNECQNGKKG